MGSGARAGLIHTRGLCACDRPHSPLPQTLATRSPCRSAHRRAKRGRNGPAKPGRGCRGTTGRRACAPRTKLQWECPIPPGYVYIGDTPLSLLCLPHTLPSLNLIHDRLGHLITVNQFICMHLQSPEPATSPPPPRLVCIPDSNRWGQTAPGAGEGESAAPTTTSSRHSQYGAHAGTRGGNIARTPTGGTGGIHTTTAGRRCGLVTASHRCK